MTKKHYMVIASQLKRLVDSSTKSYRVSVIKHLADLLKEDNPNFDRTPFLKACGIEEK